MDAREQASYSPLPPAGPDVGQQRTGWVGWSFIVGCVLAIPCAVLLAFLAALPFMLGLFFFLLLGLIIAATMFRVGSTRTPPSTVMAFAMAVGVALVLMVASLWVEYRALPASVDRVVRRSFDQTFVPAKRAKLRDETVKFVSEKLAKDYPPGGFVGYLHWAAVNGKFDCPRVFRDNTVEYRLPYRRGLWLIRLATSTLLLGWTIVTQTLALRVLPAPVEPTGDAAGREDSPPP